MGSMRRVQPGPVEGAHAEHVAPVPGERVPQADADAQVVLHALAEDHPIGVVDLESQGVVRGEPGERDPTRYVAEEWFGHVGSSCWSVQGGFESGVS